MDKPIFVDYESKICSAFLNTVANTVWDALGQATTPVQARQFIGAVEEAPNDGGLYLRSNLAWVSATTSLQHNDLGGRSTADAHPISAITGLQSELDLLESTDAAQDALIAGKVSRAGDTMTGPLVVSANSTTTAVRITQTGSGNALLVEDSTSTDTTPFLVDSAGRVVIGHTAAIGSEAFQQHGTNFGSSSEIKSQYSNDAGAPFLQFQKSRGTTIGSIVPPNSGDFLGNIQFQGNDGTAMRVSSAIRSTADGAHAVGSTPGALSLLTTPVGSTSATERMRIDANGVIYHYAAQGSAINALTRKDYVDTKVSKTSNTGSALLPAGTDAQRDTTPAVGAIRFSSTNTGWEGWNGTNWVSIGGGQMLGQALVKGIFYNSQNIAENLTIAAGTNGLSAGPIQVDNGFEVTVANGSTWSIV